MSTNVPGTENKNRIHAESIPHDELRATIKASNEKQYEAIAGRKTIDGRVAAAALAGVVALGVTGGIVAMEANKPQAAPSEEGNNNGSNDPIPTAPVEQIATATASASPSATELPGTTSVPIPNPLETTSATEVNEFGISNTEYEAIEKSFAIDANEFTTPEQVVAAFAARSEQYYMGGLTKENRDKHYTDTAPSGAVGWNAWVNELYTKAFEEAVFAPGYSNLHGDDLIKKYADNKRIINGLWSNSIKGNDTPYDVNMSFEIEDITVGGNSFVAIGMENISDNSAQVPSVATDSRKIETISNSVKLEFTKDTATNRWHLTDKTSS